MDYRGWYCIGVAYIHQPQIRQANNNLWQGQLVHVRVDQFPHIKTLPDNGTCKNIHSMLLNQAIVILFYCERKLTRL